MHNIKKKGVIGNQTSVKNVTQFFTAQNEKCTISTISLLFKLLLFHSHRYYHHGQRPIEPAPGYVWSQVSSMPSSTLQVRKRDLKHRSFTFFHGQRHSVVLYMVLHSSTRQEISLLSPRNIVIAQCLCCAYPRRPQYLSTAAYDKWSACVFSKFSVQERHFAFHFIESC